MSEQTQHNELHGALFVNSKKKQDKHPDRTGTCTIGGQEYRISGWIKQPKSGNAYLSLSFSVPQKGEDL